MYSNTKTFQKFFKKLKKSSAILTKILKAYTLSVNNSYIDFAQKLEILSMLISDYKSWNSQMLNKYILNFVNSNTKLPKSTNSLRNFLIIMGKSFAISQSNKDNLLNHQLIKILINVSTIYIKENGFLGEDFFFSIDEFDFLATKLTTDTFYKISHFQDKSISQASIVFGTNYINTLKFAASNDQILVYKISWNISPFHSKKSKLIAKVITFSAIYEKTFKGIENLEDKNVKAEVIIPKIPNAKFQNFKCSFWDKEVYFLFNLIIMFSYQIYIKQIFVFSNISNKKIYKNLK